MNAPRENRTEPLYDDEKEEKLHLGAIEVLTARAGLSADKVERLYEIVLKTFKKEARIRDYLPILVSRRVQYLLAKWTNGEKPEAPDRGRPAGEKGYNGTSG